MGIRAWAVFRRSKSGFPTGIDGRESVRLLGPQDPRYLVALVRIPPRCGGSMGSSGSGSGNNVVFRSWERNGFFLGESDGVRGRDDRYGGSGDPDACWVNVRSGKSQNRCSPGSWDRSVAVVPGARPFLCLNVHVRDGQIGD